MRFGILVRAGNHAEIENLLQREGIEVLRSWHTTGLELDRIVELEEHNNAEDVNEDGDEVDSRLINAHLTVTPLQLAIIAKQTKVIQVIIEHIANIEEAEECQNALGEVLGSKAKLDFIDAIETYDKDDRSINGMNAFHLASKYHPNAMRVIFDILNKKRVTYTNVINLLSETNFDLKQTPLHVAVRNVTSCAARYKHVKNLISAFVKKF